jgi:UDP-N-acetylglucosamine 3-dehydrogenase
MQLIDGILNIGIIGVGYWGKKIATEYSLLCKNDNRVKLYGVCDIFDDNLDFCREKLEVPFQTKSLQKILEDPQIDAVHICTPSETHYEICKEALEHGKHVTVEKPMTLNSLEAIKLVDLALKKKLVLSVGHIFRFDAAIEKTKTLLEQGWFGDLYWIKLTWTALMPPMVGRDIITDLAPHPFDILNFLTNDWPNRVTCIAKAHRKGQQEETAHITCEFPSNLLAHIEVSWLNPERRREVQIMGSKRFAKIDCMTQKITVCENEKFFDLPNERSNTIGDELLYFVNCIRSQSANQVSLNKNNGLVGANVVKLLELTRKSMENQRTQIVQ